MSERIPRRYVTYPGIAYLYLVAPKEGSVNFCVDLGLILNCFIAYKVKLCYAYVILRRMLHFCDGKSGLMIEGAPIKASLVPSS
mgnify:CR=1 FL=1